MSSFKDTISAEARKQELSENERTLLWDTSILIETTNHELTLGDTFEITSRYDGRDDQPITFPTVSGQWHVYDMVDSTAHILKTYMTHYWSHQTRLI